MSEAIQLGVTLGAESMITKIKERSFPDYFFSQNEDPIYGPTVGLVQNRGYLSKWKRDKSISKECRFTPLSTMRNLILGKDNETNRLLEAEGQILRCMVACPMPRHRLALLKIWVVLMFRLIGLKAVDRVYGQIAKLEQLKPSNAGPSGPRGMLRAAVAGQEARLLLENTWCWTYKFMDDVRDRILGDMVLSVRVTPEHVTGCSITDLPREVAKQAQLAVLQDALPMMLRDPDEAAFSSGSSVASPPKLRRGEIEVESDCSMCDDDEDVDLDEFVHDFGEL